MAKKSSFVKKPVVAAAPVAKKAPAPAPAKAAPAVSAKAAPVAAAKAAPASASKESNLKKLAASSVVCEFVKSKGGNWNHQDWLDFLADIKAKGFDPIDVDQVGLLLEERKSAYLASK